ncbi:hypothetical protein A5791_14600 [Mycobacterium sp. 852002-51163_SCH5372311]|uniref:hypothetical protein n=1 Tax=Mycobacterium sp. 852002-51163_SCH5372311 TaxID=1834097 RepID=UPI0007FC92B5|nr:hypothetical protein [Mycobacterium sp. 852002-51163_SCH5372311]OBF92092.1 hypothetical protein A5791_14600 [Mycobacterium sp. 852002-51163_SCH5372311]
MLRLLRGSIGGVVYSFRNRIRIKDGKKLEVDATEFRLSPESSNEIIIARPGYPSKKLKDVDELIISGRGYDSPEAALGAGRKWRQVLSSVFARMFLSVDLGDDVDESKVLLPETMVTGTGLEMIGIKPGAIIYEDRHGLSIYKTEPVRPFVHLSMGEVSVHVSLNEQATYDSVGQALQRHSGIWRDELKLAYQLVHSSLANENYEPRLILAVTAIEALIPYRERVAEVVTVLEKLVSHVNDMSATEIDNATRSAVLKLLDSDRYESVRQLGLKLTDRLTGEYGGKSPRKYFDEVYGTRSDLAHGNLRNVPRLSEDALNKTYIELLRFVVDILEAWTPEYSN